VVTLTRVRPCRAHQRAVGSRLETRPAARRAAESSVARASGLTVNGGDQLGARRCPFLAALDLGSSAASSSPRRRMSAAVAPVLANEAREEMQPILDLGEAARDPRARPRRTRRADAASRRGRAPPLDLPQRSLEAPVDRRQGTELSPGGCQEIDRRPLTGVQRLLGPAGRSAQLARRFQSSRAPRRALVLAGMELGAGDLLDLKAQESLRARPGPRRGRAFVGRRARRRQPGVELGHAPEERRLDAEGISTSV